MRIVQEVKVECVTQLECAHLMEWIEEQGYCTVEPTLSYVRPGIHAMVSITPWGEGDRTAQWEEFLAELAHAVQLHNS